MEGPTSFPGHTAGAVAPGGPTAADLPPADPEHTATAVATRGPSAVAVGLALPACVALAPAAPSGPSSTLCSVLCSGARSRPPPQQQLDEQQHIQQQQGEVDQFPLQQQGCVQQVYHKEHSDEQSSGSSHCSSSCVAYAQLLSTGRASPSSCSQAVPLLWEQLTGIPASISAPLLASVGTVASQPDTWSDGSGRLSQCRCSRFSGQQQQHQEVTASPTQRPAAAAPAETTSEGRSPAAAAASQAAGTYRQTRLAADGCSAGTSSPGEVVRRAGCCSTSQPQGTPPPNAAEGSATKERVAAAFVGASVACVSAAASLNASAEAAVHADANFKAADPTATAGAAQPPPAAAGADCTPPAAKSTAALSSKPAAPSLLRPPPLKSATSSVPVAKQLQQQEPLAARQQQQEQRQSALQISGPCEACAEAAKRLLYVCLHPWTQQPGCVPSAARVGEILWGALQQLETASTACQQQQHVSLRQRCRMPACSRRQQQLQEVLAARPWFSYEEQKHDNQQKQQQQGQHEQQPQRGQLCVPSLKESSPAVPLSKRAAKRAQRRQAAAAAKAAARIAAGAAGGSDECTGSCQQLPQEGPAECLKPGASAAGPSLPSFTLIRVVAQVLEGSCWLQQGQQRGVANSGEQEEKEEDAEQQQEPSRLAQDHPHQRAVCATQNGTRCSDRRTATAAGGELRVVDVSLKQRLHEEEIYTKLPELQALLRRGLSLLERRCPVPVEKEVVADVPHQQKRQQHERHVQQQEDLQMQRRVEQAEQHFRKTKQHGGEEQLRQQQRGMQGQEPISQEQQNPEGQTDSQQRGSAAEKPSDTQREQQTTALLLPVEPSLSTACEGSASSPNSSGDNPNSRSSSSGDSTNSQVSGSSNSSSSNSSSNSSSVSTRTGAHAANSRTNSSGDIGRGGGSGVCSVGGCWRVGCHCVNVVRSVPQQKSSCEEGASVVAGEKEYERVLLRMGFPKFFDLRVALLAEGFAYRSEWRGGPPAYAEACAAAASPAALAAFRAARLAATGMASSSAFVTGAGDGSLSATTCDPAAGVLQLLLSHARKVTFSASAAAASYQLAARLRVAFALLAAHRQRNSETACCRSRNHHFLAGRGRKRTRAKSNCSSDGSDAETVSTASSTRDRPEDVRLAGHADAVAKELHPAAAPGDVESAPAALVRGSALSGSGSAGAAATPESETAAACARVAAAFPAASCRKETTATERQSAAHAGDAYHATRDDKPAAAGAPSVAGAVRAAGVCNAEEEAARAGAVAKCTKCLFHRRNSVTPTAAVRQNTAEPVAHAEGLPGFFRASATPAAPPGASFCSERSHIHPAASETSPCRGTQYFCSCSSVCGCYSYSASGEYCNDDPCDCAGSCCCCLEVYAIEKLNGENAQISFAPELGAWCVCSKNVCALLESTPASVSPASPSGLPASVAATRSTTMPIAAAAPTSAAGASAGSPAAGGALAAASSDVQTSNAVRRTNSSSTADDRSAHSSVRGGGTACGDSGRKTGCARGENFLWEGEVTARRFEYAAKVRRLWKEILDGKTAAEVATLQSFLSQHTLVGELVGCSDKQHFVRYTYPGAAKEETFSLHAQQPPCQEVQHACEFGEQELLKQQHYEPRPACAGVPSADRGCAAAHTESEQVLPFLPCSTVPAASASPSASAVCFSASGAAEAPSLRGAAAAADTGQKLIFFGVVPHCGLQLCLPPRVAFAILETFKIPAARVVRRLRAASPQQLLVSLHDLTREIFCSDVDETGEGVVLTFAAPLLPLLRERAAAFSACEFLPTTEGTAEVTRHGADAARAWLSASPTQQEEQPDTSFTGDREGTAYNGCSEVRLETARWTGSGSGTCVENSSWCGEKDSTGRNRRCSFRRVGQQQHASQRYRTGVAEPTTSESPAHQATAAAATCRAPSVALAASAGDCGSKNTWRGRGAPQSTETTEVPRRLSLSTSMESSDACCFPLKSTAADTPSVALKPFSCLVSTQQRLAVATASADAQTFTAVEKVQTGAGAAPAAHGLPIASMCASPSVSSSCPQSDLDKQARFSCLSSAGSASSCLCPRRVSADLQGQPSEAFSEAAAATVVLGLAKVKSLGYLLRRKMREKVRALLLSKKFFDSLIALPVPEMQLRHHEQQLRAEQRQHCPQHLHAAPTSTKKAGFRVMRRDSVETARGARGAASTSGEAAARTSNAAAVVDPSGTARGRLPGLEDFSGKATTPAVDASAAAPARSRGSSASPRYRQSTRGACDRESGVSNAYASSQADGVLRTGCWPCLEEPRAEILGSDAAREAVAVRGTASPPATTAASRTGRDVARDAAACCVDVAESGQVALTRRQDVASSTSCFSAPLAAVASLFSRPPAPVAGLHEAPVRFMVSNFLRFAASLLLTEAPGFYRGAEVLRQHAAAVAADWHSGESLPWDACIQEQAERPPALGGTAPDDVCEVTSSEADTPFKTSVALGRERNCEDFSAGNRSDADCNRWGSGGRSSGSNSRDDSSAGCCSGGSGANKSDGGVSERSARCGVELGESAAATGTGGANRTKNKEDTRAVKRRCSAVSREVAEAAAVGLVLRLANVFRGLIQHACSLAARAATNVYSTDLPASVAAAPDVQQQRAHIQHKTEQEEKLKRALQKLAEFVDLRFLDFTEDAAAFAAQTNTKCHAAGTWQLRSLHRFCRSLEDQRVRWPCLHIPALKSAAAPQARLEEADTLSTVECLQEQRRQQQERRWSNSKQRHQSRQDEQPPEALERQFGLQKAQGDSAVSPRATDLHLREEVVKVRRPVEGARETTAAADVKAVAHVVPGIPPVADAAECPVAQHTQHRAAWVCSVCSGNGESHSEQQKTLCLVVPPLTFPVDLFDALGAACEARGVRLVLRHQLFHDYSDRADSNSRKSSSVTGVSSSGVARPSSETTTARRHGEGRSAPFVFEDGVCTSTSTGAAHSPTCTANSPPLYPYDNEDTSNRRSLFAPSRPFTMWRQGGRYCCLRMPQQHVGTQRACSEETEVQREQHQQREEHQQQQQTDVPQLFVVWGYGSSCAAPGTEAEGSAPGSRGLRVCLKNLRQLMISAAQECHPREQRVQQKQQGNHEQQQQIKQRAVVSSNSLTCARRRGSSRSCSNSGSSRIPPSSTPEAQAKEECRRQRAYTELYVRRILNQQPLDGVGGVESREPKSRFVLQVAAAALRFCSFRREDEFHPAKGVTSMGDTVQVNGRRGLPEGGCHRMTEDTSIARVKSTGPRDDIPSSSVARHYGIVAVASCESYSRATVDAAIAAHASSRESVVSAPDSGVDKAHRTFQQEEETTNGARQETEEPRDEGRSESRELDGVKAIKRLKIAGESVHVHAEEVSGSGGSKENMGEVRERQPLPEKEEESITWSHVTTETQQQLQSVVVTNATFLFLAAAAAASGRKGMSRQPEQLSSTTSMESLEAGARKVLTSWAAAVGRVEARMKAQRQEPLEEGTLDQLGCTAIDDSSSGGGGVAAPGPRAASGAAPAHFSALTPTVHERTATAATTASVGVEVETGAAAPCERCTKRPSRWPEVRWPQVIFINSPIPFVLSSRSCSTASSPASALCQGHGAASSEKGSAAGESPTAATSRCVQVRSFRAPAVEVEGKWAGLRAAAEEDSCWERPGEGAVLATQGTRHRQDVWEMSRDNCRHFFPRKAKEGICVVGEGAQCIEVRNKESCAARSIPDQARPETELLSTRTITEDVCGRARSKETVCDHRNRKVALRRLTHLAAIDKGTEQFLHALEFLAAAPAIAQTTKRRYIRGVPRASRIFLSSEQQQSNCRSVEQQHRRVSGSVTMSGQQQSNQAGENSSRNTAALVQSAQPGTAENTGSSSSTGLASDGRDARGDRKEVAEDQQQQQGAHRAATETLPSVLVTCILPVGFPGCGKTTALMHLVNNAVANSIANRSVAWWETQREKERAEQPRAAVDYHAQECDESAGSTESRGREQDHTQQVFYGRQRRQHEIQQQQLSRQWQPAPQLSSSTSWDTDLHGFCVDDSMGGADARGGGERETIGLVVWNASRASAFSWPTKTSSSLHTSASPAGSEELHLDVQVPGRIQHQDHEQQVHQETQQLGTQQQPRSQQQQEEQHQQPQLVDHERQKRHLGEQQQELQPDLRKRGICSSEKEFLEKADGEPEHKCSQQVEGAFGTVQPATGDGFLHRGDSIKTGGAWGNDNCDAKRTTEGKSHAGDDMQNVPGERHAGGGRDSRCLQQDEALRASHVEVQGCPCVSRYSDDCDILFYVSSDEATAMALRRKGYAVPSSQGFQQAVHRLVHSSYGEPTHACVPAGDMKVDDAQSTLQADDGCVRAQDGTVSAHVESMQEEGGGIRAEGGTVCTDVGMVGRAGEAALERAGRADGVLVSGEFGMPARATVGGIEEDAGSSLPGSGAPDSVHTEGWYGGRQSHVRASAEGLFHVPSGDAGDRRVQEEADRRRVEATSVSDTVFKEAAREGARYLRTSVEAFFSALTEKLIQWQRCRVAASHQQLSQPHTTDPPDTRNFAESCSAYDNREQGGDRWRGEGGAAADVRDTTRQPMLRVCVLVDKNHPLDAITKQALFLQRQIQQLDAAVSHAWLNDAVRRRETESGGATTTVRGESDGREVDGSSSDSAAAAGLLQSEVQVAAAAVVGADKLKEVRSRRSASVKGAVCLLTLPPDALADGTLQPRFCPPFSRKSHPAQDDSSLSGDWPVPWSSMTLCRCLERVLLRTDHPTVRIRHAFCGSRRPDDSSADYRMKGCGHAHADAAVGKGEPSEGEAVPHVHKKVHTDSGNANAAITVCQAQPAAVDWRQHEVAEGGVPCTEVSTSRGCPEGVGHLSAGAGGHRVLEPEKEICRIVNVFLSFVALYRGRSLLKEDLVKLCGVDRVLPLFSVWRPERGCPRQQPHTKQAAEYANERLVQSLHSVAVPADTTAATATADGHCTICRISRPDTSAHVPRKSEKIQAVHFEQSAHHSGQAECASLSSRVRRTDGGELQRGDEEEEEEEEAERGEGSPPTCVEAEGQHQAKNVRRICESPGQEADTEVAGAADPIDDVSVKSSVFSETSRHGTTRRRTVSRTTISDAWALPSAVECRRLLLKALRCMRPFDENAQNHRVYIHLAELILRAPQNAEAPCFPHASHGAAVTVDSGSCRSGPLQSSALACSGTEAGLPSVREHTGKEIEDLLKLVYAETSAHKFCRMSAEQHQPGATREQRCREQLQRRHERAQQRQLQSRLQHRQKQQRAHELTPHEPVHRQHRRDCLLQVLHRPRQEWSRQVIDVQELETHQRVRDRRQDQAPNSRSVKENVGGTLLYGTHRAEVSPRWLLSRKRRSCDSSFQRETLHEESSAEQQKSAPSGEGSQVSGAAECTPAGNSCGETPSFSTVKAELYDCCRKDDDKALQAAFTSASAGGSCTRPPHPHTEQMAFPENISTCPTQYITFNCGTTSVDCSPTEKRIAALSQAISKRMECAELTPDSSSSGTVCEEYGLRRAQEQPQQHVEQQSTLVDDPYALIRTRLPVYYSIDVDSFGEHLRALVTTGLKHLSEEASTVHMRSIGQQFSSRLAELIPVKKLHVTAAFLGGGSVVSTVQSLGNIERHIDALLRRRRWHDSENVKEKIQAAAPGKLRRTKAADCRSLSPVECATGEHTVERAGDTSATQAISTQLLFAHAACRRFVGTKYRVQVTHFLFLEEGLVAAAVRPLHSLLLLKSTRSSSSAERARQTGPKTAATWMSPSCLGKASPRSVDVINTRRGRSLSRSAPVVPAGDALCRNRSSIRFHSVSDDALYSKHYREADATAVGAHPVLHAERHEKKEHSPHTVDNTRLKMYGIDTSAVLPFTGGVFSHITLYLAPNIKAQFSNPALTSVVEAAVQGLYRGHLAPVPELPYRTPEYPGHTVHLSEVQSSAGFQPEITSLRKQGTYGKSTADSALFGEIRDEPLGEYGRWIYFRNVTLCDNRAERIQALLWCLPGDAFIGTEGCFVER